MPTSQSTEETDRKAHWLIHQQAAEEADTSSVAARGTNPGAALMRCKWHLRELAQYEAQILELLSPAQKKRYTDAFKALPGKLEAWVYAAAELKTARLELPGAANDEVKLHTARGKELRERGLFWVKVLQQLGKVRRERVAAIEAGSGYLDLASDLVAISELLDANWKLLGGLLAEAEADAPIVTEAEVKEMKQIGVRLSDLLVSRRVAESVPGVDWKKQALGMMALCHADWEEVRTCARFYFDRVGDKLNHRSLIQLKGMNRFELRP